MAGGLTEIAFLDVELPRTIPECLASCTRLGTAPACFNWPAACPGKTNEEARNIKFAFMEDYPEYFTPCRHTEADIAYKACVRGRPAACPESTAASSRLTIDRGLQREAEEASRQEREDEAAEEIWREEAREAAEEAWQDNRKQRVEEAELRLFSSNTSREMPNFGIRASEVTPYLDVLGSWVTSKELKVQRLLHPPAWKQPPPQQPAWKQPPPQPTPPRPLSQQPSQHSAPPPSLLPPPLPQLPHQQPLQAIAAATGEEETPIPRASLSSDTSISVTTSPDVAISDDDRVYEIVR